MPVPRAGRGTFLHHSHGRQRGTHPLHQPAIHRKSAPAAHAADTLRRLYRPEDVAAVLGCSAWWVKDRARRRLIPFARIGRAYRFTGEHLAEIVRMNEERPERKAHSPRGIATSAPKPTTRQRTEAATSTTRLKARPPSRRPKPEYGTAA
ncbi:helix-turn-helix domain-containing protein [Streptomyces niveus]|uniref:helix-turn-helix domain-containing protein n=1 Tax=Streptomyces niveus TaxID=193462 RepID=UPI00369CC0D2